MIYDRNFDVYLAVYQTGLCNGSGTGFKVRSSSDLVHWSEPIAAPHCETGRALYYPTLMGESGDPTIGGPAPRIYFSSFPTGSFPEWRAAIIESVPLTLSPGH